MEQRLKGITDFIFVADKVSKPGLLIVPGTFRTGIVRKAVDLYRKGLVKHVITTGGVTQSGRKSLTEAEFQKQFLMSNGVPENIVSVENKSTNTKENAIFAKKTARKYGLDTGYFILVAKTYHARRLLMTFQKVFPKSTIKIVPASDDRNITRDNWYKDKKKAGKVMEEVAKVGEYYLRGDLKF